ncbi:MurR/RpiR family transcriptional regulator [Oceanobacillus damuensis]|uniref:MurR/RpiR family transcriptional regulator n=1 Tax=Oceanobacillus damuensis TaxID=937928 RepID=UPI000835F332|nr:MurR/RpiR family transcriptional regulator [Oceanobacillus damuensis]
MNFENRIQKYNSILTSNDRKIIRYLMTNKDIVISKTITDLSEEIEVSPASITRFCKRLDFDSFQQMKYSIEKTVVETTKTDKTFGIIYNYYDSIIKSTQQFISEEQTSKIVGLMLSANNVLFCGVGNSGLIANEFNSRIQRMGIPSQSTTDAHGMLMKSALLNENDLLICFSNSGKTKSVINSAKLAKENKATTIAVTNYEDTMLTKLADEVILISSYKYIEDEKFINTQIPGLFLLDVLTYKLLNHEKLMEHRKKTLRAISEYG